jgi:hypothetical protein
MTLWQLALGVLEELGARPHGALIRAGMGELALNHGDLPWAAGLLGESMTVLREIGNRRHIAPVVESLAKLAGLAGQPMRAATLYGAAEALREAVNTSLTPSQRAAYEQDVARLRDELDSEAFTVSWSEGRALPVEQAFSEAIAVAH